VLGDVVLDRLATRGVDTEQISWDARRNGHEPWQVLVRFASGDKLREATWEVDLTARMTRAIDDEARWLSETDLETTPARRHLQSVRSTPVYDVEADQDGDGTEDHLAQSLQAVDAGLAREASTGDRPDEDETTAALLDELSANRGVRPGGPEEEADQSVQEPMLWDDPPAAHPSASHPEETPEDAQVLSPPGEEPAIEAEEKPKPPPRRRTRRNRRTSVPSWDEIVFGAKND